MEEQINYKLGELSQGFVNLEKRLDNIERKVDALNVWRFKIIGGTGVLAGIISFLTNLFFNR